ncbi:hypothetical protein [Nitrosospira multiformis]|uniref:Uncharacterized protein n=1 Tax=Nitrosospira multiformis TaxID=1231 RepID=A0A1I7I6B4_9PROT|nr:hypothetical protein [Nitrosospira multiformis]SFU68490.1 hypothetical protein SAMN05216417_1157 [Nitrosospira multiformis]
MDGSEYIRDLIVFPHQDEIEGIHAVLIEGENSGEQVLQSG